MAKAKIVICGSSSFQEEFKYWKEKLEELNYQVLLYPRKIDENEFLQVYPEIHKEHYQKMTKAGIILVLNFDKDNVKNYIGPSAFAEIAFAIGLKLTQNKKIEVMCLNPLPKGLPYSEELERWQKLGWLKICENKSFGG